MGIVEVDELEVHPLPGLDGANLALLGEDPGVPDGGELKELLEARANPASARFCTDPACLEGDSHRLPHGRVDIIGTEADPDAIHEPPCEGSCDYADEMGPGKET